MTDTFRAICAELLRRWDAANGDHDLIDVADAMDRARALLAQPEPEGLTDEELLDLMPQQFRDDLATVSRTAAHGAGHGITPGIFRVSLNTGALDYARAAIAADRARRPTPQPPADGEVGDLVARLRESADCCEISSWMKRDYKALARAADLLERLASPACLVINPSPEALASLKAAGPGRIERLPLLELVAQPVAVSERPWEREGWCDEQGRCWWTANKPGPLPPSWWMVSIPQSCTDGIMLPANALPLPQGNDN